MNASWRLCAVAFCRAEQFGVSPLMSGLTPWGHNKKKEQMQTRFLTLHMLMTMMMDICTWESVKILSAPPFTAHGCLSINPRRSDMIAPSDMTIRRQRTSLCGDQVVTFTLHYPNLRSGGREDSGPSERTEGKT